MATIQFSDGSTTIDLTGVSGDYALMYDSWSPKVAKRRVSTMGGRSPYEDVRETMQIKVKGTSETDCLANLTTLSELFDQANAWGRGENVTAVEIQYQHTGSSTQVDAVIWDAEIMPPTNFTWMGTIDDDVIYPVTLSFLRRGLWLGATESESASSSTGNPAILTTTSYSDTATILRPIDINTFVIDVTANLPASDIYLLIQNSANHLYLQEAEGLTLSNATSTVVSGSSAGSVARCDSSAGSDATITDSDTGSFEPLTAIFYAVVRNLSASTCDWSIRLDASVSGGLGTVEGKTTVIPAGDNTRQVVDLGRFSLNPGIELTHIQLVCSPSATGVASTDDLDVDYICGIEVDESANILKLTTGETATDTDIAFACLHNLDSKLDPWISAATVTASWAPGIEGDAMMFVTGSAVSGLIFGVDTAGTKWTLGDVESDISQFTVIRQKSYLTPP